MVKEIVITITIALLSACAVAPPAKIVYQEVKIPIIVVPAPPKFERPVLEIDKLSDLQKEDEGQLAKAYVITIKQLEDYSDRQQQSIDKYDDLSKQNILPADPLDK
jgi:type IV pilus biogenesis protein CpaD/CtpE